MCNVEDEGVTHPEKFSDAKKTVGQKCVKCDQPGVLITRIHDSFCKDCFQIYVIHKFRAAIGKSKLIREGEHVLVAFSGGSNSAALLHLIQDGLSQRAHRKLRFIPTLLHVDECGVLDLPIKERQDMRQNIAQIMARTGFPSYITDLEQALNINREENVESKDINEAETQDGEMSFQLWPVQEQGDVTVLPLSSTDQCDRLKSLAGSLASATSQEDFLRNLRNQLIVAVARRLGFTKVLTADSTTRLAVRILTDVAQGRGSQLSLNAGFSDARNKDVMFVRPVRDLNAKELAMYNSLFGVDSVFVPTLTTKGLTGASIERLTETFVTGLQAEYPSTVSNIFRTSQKLGLPDIEQSLRCSFCQSPLDTNVDKASALKATEFSQKLSKSSQLSQQLPVTDNGGGGGDCCNGTQQSCQSEQNMGVTYKEVIQSLCYGCRLSLRNAKLDSPQLPDFITEEAKQQSQRSQMKDQISDYLLDHDEDDNDDER